MKNMRSAASLVAVAALTLAGMGATAVAHAGGNVYWSIGLSSPGVQVGVGSGVPYVVHQPVYVQPYPVYIEPRPVYVQPRPVYIEPRPVIYVRPAPVHFAPPEYIQSNWQRPGPGWRQGHRHHRHDDYRSDRHDGRRSGHDRHDNRRD